MIHRFSFSNFFSFRDEQTIDFTVNEHAPDTEAYVESAFGTRIGKVLVLFGHNASGKTNVLRALSFLRWFIVDSFDEKPEENMFVMPFLFGADVLPPSTFSVQFEVQEELFTYEISLTRERVISERLDVKSAGEKRFRKLFSRTWNESSGEFDVDAERIRLPKKYEGPKKRGNASLIALGIQVNNELCQRVGVYWKMAWTNIRNAIEGTLPMILRLMEASKIYLSDGNSFETAKDLLRRCDLGLQDIVLREIPRSPEGEASSVFAYSMHRVGDTVKTIPFFDESDGSQALYVHLVSLLPILRGGGAAIVDEIDADLHQLVIPKLIELFVSRNTNPNNAQLICSCHSTPLLNHLDKYQVLLVEKNEEQSSEVWRLDDVRVRSDDNYYAKYMAGAYGAVPKF
jgi:uncharacterized protein